jgi:hypothetical protein
MQDTFCLTFSVEMDFFGDLRTIGLKPGGEDIPVTEENRHEYVELMVDYLLNRSDRGGVCVCVCLGGGEVGRLGSTGGTGGGRLFVSRELSTLPRF